MILLGDLYCVIVVVYCYGPYKQDSTDIQRESKTGQDQYARGGTDRTSETIGRGVGLVTWVARDEELGTWERGNVGTWERNILIYQRTNVLNLYYGEELYI